MPLVVTHGGGEWAQGLGLILGAVAGRKQAKRDDEEYKLEREKAEHEARKLEMEIEGLERKEADRKRIVDYERLKIARAGSQVATGSMAGTAPATSVSGGAAPMTSVPGGAAPMPAIPSGVYEDMSSLPSFTGGQIGVDFENVWKPIDLEVLSHLQSVKAIEDFKADMTAQQDQKVLEYDRNKVISDMNGLKRLVASSIDAEGLTVEIDGFIQQLSGAVDRESLLEASQAQTRRFAEISDGMQTEYMRDTVWKPWFDRTMADIAKQVDAGTLSEEAGNDLMKQLLADNESVVRDGEDPRLFMRGLNAREMAALRKSVSDHQRALTASQAQVQQLSSVTAQALSATPPTPGAAWADVSSEDQGAIVGQAVEAARTAVADAGGPVDPTVLVAEAVDRLLSEKGLTASASQMEKIVGQASDSLLGSGRGLSALTDEEKSEAAALERVAKPPGRGRPGGADGVRVWMSGPGAETVKKAAAAFTAAGGGDFGKDKAALEFLRDGVDPEHIFKVHEWRKATGEWKRGAPQRFASDFRGEFARRSKKWRRAPETHPVGVRAGAMAVKLEEMEEHFFNTPEGQEEVHTSFEKYGESGGGLGHAQDKDIDLFQDAHLAGIPLPVFTDAAHVAEAEADGHRAFRYVEYDPVDNPGKMGQGPEYKAIMAHKSRADRLKAYRDFLEDVPAPAGPEPGTRGRHRASREAASGKTREQLLRPGATEGQPAEAAPAQAPGPSRPPRWKHKGAAHRGAAHRCSQRRRCVISPSEGRDRRGIRPRSPPRRRRRTTTTTTPRLLG